MKNIFSFCIYGDDLKYYYGLQKNIDLIRTHYPDFYIYIYCGKDHLKSWVGRYRDQYEKVEFFPTEREGAINMLFRYMPICDDDINILFIRDADSEINGRDRWCIQQFLASTKSAHTIRDHYWHKSRLTGGLTGFKLGMLKCRHQLHDAISKTEVLDPISYGGDETFLNDKIYPLVVESLLIHTSINAFNGEGYELIDYENDDTNFVGNVVEYDGSGNASYKFRYWDFPMQEQADWLISMNQFALVSHITRNIKRSKMTSQLLDTMFMAKYYQGDVDGCIDVIRNFEFVSITDHNVRNNDFLFHIRKLAGKRIVATTDISYEPADNEIAVYYGSYPVSHRMFPISNKVYRNAAYFGGIAHDRVMYASCWKDIDMIYILNLEERRDRLIEVLGELCRMGAPLDRVYHHKAKKDGDVRSAYLGATRNHLDVMDHMMTEGLETCLILEDDIVFTNDIKRHQKDLKMFLERGYDYDICFLAASRYHTREEHDDLLILSRQVCTTSSAYLLNSKTLKKVHDCVKEGYDKLMRTGDSNAYCIDRYWAKLQPDNKTFIFRHKMCYQRPNYSNLKRAVSAHLD